MEPPGWAPDAGMLSAAVWMLETSRVGDTGSQQAAYAALQESVAHPEFMQYLTFVLVHRNDLAVAVRLVAAGTLRAQAESGWDAAAPAVRDYLQAEVVKVLLEGDARLARAGANVIATIVRALDRLSDWPVLPVQLVQLLDATAGMSQLAGVVACVQLLAEDVAEEFEDDDVGRAALLELVPRLIAAMGHADVAVRVAATRTLSLFHKSNAAGLLAHRDAYFAALAALMADPDATVRETVLAALAIAINADADALWGGIVAILEFALAALGDGGHPAVVKGACDVWDELAGYLCTEKRQAPDVLLAAAPMLPRVVAVLVRLHQLGEEDLEGEVVEDVADADVPDRLESVAPTESRGEDGGSRRDGAAGRGDLLAAAADGDDAVETEEGVEAEAEGEEGGGIDPHNSGAWTVRRAAASALETLAMAYGEPVLTESLKLVGEWLGAPATDETWQQREAGLFVLGSLAEGCSDDLAGSMGTLLPFFIATSRDKWPFVRATACSVLGWFSPTLCDLDAMSAEIAADAEVDAAGAGAGAAAAAALAATPRTRHVGEAVEALAARLLDHTKKVRSTAARALIDLISVCDTQQIAEHGPAIFDGLVAGLATAQLQTRLLIMDALANLIEGGPAWATAAHAGIAGLARALADRFLTLPPAAFELTTVAGTLGAFITPAAAAMTDVLPAIFKHASDLLQREMVLDAEAGDGHGTTSSAGSDARIANSMELLTAITVALGATTVDWHVAASVPDAVALCMSHNSFYVRQSAYGLAGVLVKAAPAIMAPFAPAVITAGAAALRDEHERDLVANNAAYMLMEIAELAGTEFRTYLVETFGAAMAVVLGSPDRKQTLYHTVAVLLGVLGVSFPVEMGTSLGVKMLVIRWMRCIAMIDYHQHADDLERALAGFCNVIAHNPDAVACKLNRLVDFVHLALYHPTPPDALAAALRATWLAIQSRTQPEVLALLPSKLDADMLTRAASFLAT